MKFRITLLAALMLPPLWGEHTFRTEEEVQSSPGVSEFGASDWFFYSYRPAPKSRFGFGANARYFKSGATNRGEFTANGTLYVGQGFINLNPGITTEGRWTTSVVTGYKRGKWLALGLADPKWHRNASLPTTVFAKCYGGRGPLFFRIDDFRAGGKHLFAYVGAEVRLKAGEHIEFFGAPQVSLLGAKKLVLQFGVRTSFKLAGKTK